MNNKIDTENTIPWQWVILGILNIFGNLVFLLILIMLVIFTFFSSSILSLIESLWVDYNLPSVSIWFFSSWFFSSFLGLFFLPVLLLFIFGIFITIWLFRWQKWTLVFLVIWTVVLIIISLFDPSFISLFVTCFALWLEIICFRHPYYK